MNAKKKKLVDEIMMEFNKHDGGTAIEAEFTTAKAQGLKKNLQDSLNDILPDLVKRVKLRKHVMFDEDVFETYDGLSKSCDAPFSALINSVLRKFAKERFSISSSNSDPVAELLAVRERERELIDQIKELDLSEELSLKIG